MKLKKAWKMNKAVFIDRDGTLNEDPGYVHKLEDLKLYDGVIEGLHLLKDFKLFIITNQSGIGRGYYKEEDMHKFNERLLKELSKNNIKIEKIYFCPHTPEEECECRKPTTKFIDQARQDYNLNLNESWVIGDHPYDVIMAKNAGCSSVYVLTGHGNRHLKELEDTPAYTAENLLGAAKYILMSPNVNKKIKKIWEIQKIVVELRDNSKKIVFCSGCFDILHKGHIKFLEEAKKQGDILIVALNSDSSVKQNKGEGRPLNSGENRAKVLASLDLVDYMVIFSEKNPIKLIELIKPEVFVNGEEYGENCIEAPTVKKYGGRIYIVKNYGGFSTTKLIEKILDSYRK